MPVRQLVKELQIRAKNEVNEDPERTEKDLQYIREWLKKQPHINARTDDQWLLSFLRGCKFSLERTKEKLDMFYTMRTVIPEFFKDRDPLHPDIMAVVKQGVFLPLWQSGSVDMPMFVILRVGSYDPHKISFQQIMKTNMMLMDLSLLDDDVTFINGVRVVQDMSGVSLAHMAAPSITKKAMTCFQEAYPNRIKGIHFVNIPIYFETLFGMIKPFLNEKMKNRVTVHGSDSESMYKIIPKKMLPKEYGGDGNTIQDIIDSVVEKLEKYRSWFTEDEQYKTLEHLRPGKPKTGDEIFGIEGSFRKLNFD